jgi:hypothetical protein
VSADSRITALGVGVDWPRIDKDATLVIPSRRYTLWIAGRADLVAIVNTRPTTLVFHDDAVAVVVAHLVGVDVDTDGRGVSCSVRCGQEAQREASAERGLGDVDSDAARPMLRDRWCTMNSRVWCRRSAPNFPPGLVRRSRVMGVVDSPASYWVP